MLVRQRSAEWSRRKAGSAITAAHLFCTVALVVWYVWLRPVSGVDAASLIYPLSVVLLALFVWSLWSWYRMTGNVFDPYGLFLVAAILFNGGQALLEVFHFNKNGILGNRYTPETILATLFLVTLSVAALHLGALISAGRRERPPVRRSTVREALSPSPEQIRFVGWMLLLLASLPTILLLKTAVTVVLSSGYAALYQQESATGISAAPLILANFLVPGNFFLLCGSRESRRGRIVSIIVITVYTVIELFLGYRYYAVMPLIAWAWLWHRTIRPIPRGVLLGAGAAMLIFVFPVIATTRDTSGAQRLSWSVLSRAYSSIDNPLVTIISEMGGSMRTVTDTLTLVPSVRGYDMGASYFYAALTLVPNLFWDIHPTIAHGVLTYWLVWLVDPTFALVGGSYGYSFIAEAFLNFGWFGAPIFLGIIGYCYGRFVLWADRSGMPARLATVASYASFFVFFARAEAADVFRPLIWYALVPYLLVCLVVHLGIRRPARPSTAAPAASGAVTSTPLWRQGREKVG